LLMYSRSNAVISASDNSPSRYRIARGSGIVVISCLPVMPGCLSYGRPPVDAIGRAALQSIADPLRTVCEGLTGYAETGRERLRARQLASSLGAVVLEDKVATLIRKPPQTGVQTRETALDLRRVLRGGHRVRRRDHFDCDRPRVMSFQGFETDESRDLVAVT